MKNKFELLTNDNPLDRKKMLNPNISISLDTLSVVDQAQLLYDISCIATERLRKGSYSLKTFFGRDPHVDQAYRLLDKIRLMCINPNDSDHLTFNQEGLDALAIALENLNLPKPKISGEPYTF